MDSTPRAADRWTTREAPVLVKVAEELDRADRLSVSDIHIGGLGTDDVQRSLRALEDGGYIRVDWRATWIAAVTGITPAGRRAAGQWPSQDDLVPRLAEVLAQVAETTEDPTTKGRLQRAAEAVAALTGKVVVEVGARMVEHQIGLG